MRPYESIPGGGVRQLTDGLSDSVGVIPLPCRLADGLREASALASLGRRCQQTKVAHARLDTAPTSRATEGLESC